MQLDLIGMRCDIGCLEQLLELLDGEVADADSAGFAALVNGLHLFPCIRQFPVVVDVPFFVRQSMRNFSGPRVSQVTQPTWGTLGRCLSG